MENASNNDVELYRFDVQYANGATGHLLVRRAQQRVDNHVINIYTCLAPCGPNVLPGIYKQPIIYKQGPPLEFLAKRDNAFVPVPVPPLPSQTVRAYAIIRQKFTIGEFRITNIEHIMQEPLPHRPHRR